MIYHVVTEPDFISHLAGAVFVPAGLQRDGFVHCALGASVIAVANDYFGGVDGNLLLLEIDPARLAAETRYEEAAPIPGGGTSHLASGASFPHVFGPIDTDAIIRVGLLGKTGSGYDWPREFALLDTFVAGGREAATHDVSRDFLRHTLATLGYRAAKVVRDAPDGFGAFSIGESSRTPCEILAHIGDLLEWMLSMAKGEEVWRNAAPGAWDDEVARFFAAIRRVEEHLASDASLACDPKRLFQGPVADALTHVGQLAMLRRVAGAAIRGENYYRADIAAGRVGEAQSAPRREFE
jgi:uncharacterized protein (DUF952 family)